LLALLLLCGSWGIISAPRVKEYPGNFTASQFQFGDFTLDQSRYQLRRDTSTVRLEKLPMELLILLLQRRGELVSRDEITEHLWGKDVFLDVDHSINVAVRKIRAALRDDPERPRFIETVVGKGYRFAAAVNCSNGDADLQGQPLPPPAQPASGSAPLTTGKRTASTRLRVLLGGAVVLAIFMIALVLNRGGAKGVKPPPITSLAVLPLKNLSGDPSQEYLADGMTESVIGRLSGIHDLRVISRTSVMHFKDTRLSVPEIAKALHVDAIVEGSVIREGSRIRVHAQLIRGATDEHFWSETYDRDLQDALALESDVAQSIARRVEVTVTGEERERLVAARHVSPEVYETYLKGEFAKSNSRAEIEESIAYFEEAIREDATFAPAYVGLANAYTAIGSSNIGGAPPSELRPKVISAIRKALELDSALPEAHALLAVVYQSQWQWSDAEGEFKRALDLNPNDAGAHLAFARWLLSQGRTEEALDWSRRARVLDPEGRAGTEIAWILFNARRYGEATHELRSVLAVRPNDSSALWFLGFALIADGQSEEAIPVLEKTVSIMDRSPGAIGVLVRAYAHAGRRTDALRLLAELKRRKQAGYVPAAAFVNAYLGLGDYDQAFAWLEQAYQEQSSILLWLKVHPFFDPLRGDPRFADLLRRVGLDHAQ
jgi:TolB-like protein/DNA-binding winged helix-turn-helix (wHTH) protein/Tfp pilus assembly protein PilF